MKHFFLKRLAVFFLSFMAVCGMVAVDRACSDMSARDEQIGIALSSAGEEAITLSYFGRESEIDVGVVKQQLYAIKENWEMVKGKIAYD